MQYLSPPINMRILILVIAENKDMEKNPEID